MLKRLLLGIAGAAMLASGALAQTAAISLDMPRQPLDAALRTLAQTGNVNILFDPRLVAGRRAPALSGRMSAAEAMRRLLAGAPLTYKTLAGGALIVERAPEPPVQRPQPPATRPSAQEGAMQPMPVEPVVVTVQRRSENMQKAPLAISAFTGAALVQAGGRDIGVLSSTAPNIQVQASGDGSAQVAMRGIVNTNNNEVGDPAIAMHIDGVYLARPSQAGVTLYDVDRLEVLRGPQGTLYGRNATAGVINIITRKPTDRFEGYVTAEAGNYGLYGLDGAVNLPLAPGLAGRAAFSLSTRRSYYDNSPTKSYGQPNARNVRLHLRYDGIEKLNLLASADWAHLDGTPPASGIPLPLKPGQDPYRYNPYIADGSYDVTNFGASLNADYRLTPEWSLHYLGAYRSERRVSTGSYSTLPFRTFLKVRPDQYTQEVRAAYEGARTKFIGGLYYFSEANASETRQEYRSAFFQPNVSSVSQAAYMQVTTPLDDRVNLTVGLRHTRDRKSRTGASYAYAPDTVPGPFLSVFPQILVRRNFADFSWSKTNYRIALDAQIAEQSMVYASLATGYKAGGYFDGTANNEYGPENVRSLEIGTRNQFFGNRFRLNATMFHLDYTNFQVSYFDTSIITTRTWNAQLATNYGAEIDAIANLTDRDQLTIGVATQRARYRRFILPETDNFNRNDYSGNRLQQAPDLQINLGYMRRTTLASGAILRQQLYLHYQSKNDLSFRGVSSSVQKAFTKLDATLTYIAPRGHWEASAYVRNITNEPTLIFAAVDPPPAMGTSTGAFAPPRTFGVQLTARFD